jgi:23S rRNA pseudouridine2605 synthase
LPLRPATTDPMRARKRGGPGRRHKPSAALHAAEPERLQKLLARAGLASRREAEEWIRAGRITLNGEVATLGIRAGPADDIRLDGRVVHQRATPTADVVFICHRSPGENLRQPLTETQDDSSAPPSARRALTDRLPGRAGRRFIAVSPMPRIDGGLELVTSDGELAARLQRAVRHLSNEFSVRVKGELLAEQIDRILEGALDRGEALAVERCEPAGGEAANRWYAVEVRGASGKDVRQLFERQGALVSRVLRTKLGPLTLERTLGRGRFRPVTPEELAGLVNFN